MTNNTANHLHENNTKNKTVTGELPFMKIEIIDGAHKVKNWSPTITGSTLEDRAIGKRYAEKLIEQIRKSKEDPDTLMLIDWIIDDMDFSGELDDVNRAFITRIFHELTIS